MRLSGHVRNLLVVAAALVPLGAGAWYGLHNVPYDVSYEIEAEFAEVPPTDAELEAWLRTRPGMLPYHVDVRRERAGDR